MLLIHDIHALFVFPGGIGTFDELFDVLVQQDTGKLRRIPVVLVDSEGGLWNADCGSWASTYCRAARLARVCVPSSVGAQR